MYSPTNQGRDLALRLSIGSYLLLLLLLVLVTCTPYLMEIRLASIHLQFFPHKDLGCLIAEKKNDSSKTGRTSLSPPPATSAAFVLASLPGAQRFKDERWSASRLTLETPSSNRHLPARIHQRLRRHPPELSYQSSTQWTRLDWIGLESSRHYHR